MPISNLIEGGAIIRGKVTTPSGRPIIKKFNRRLMPVTVRAFAVGLSGTEQPIGKKVNTDAMGWYEISYN